VQNFLLILAMKKLPKTFINICHFKYIEMENVNCYKMPLATKIFSISFQEEALMHFSGISNF